MKKIISILLVIVISVQCSWTEDIYVEDHRWEEPNTPNTTIAFVGIDYMHNGRFWYKEEMSRECYEFLKQKYPDAKFIAIPCPFSIPPLASETYASEWFSDDLKLFGKSRCERCKNTFLKLSIKQEYLDGQQNPDPETPETRERFYDIKDKQSIIGKVVSSNIPESFIYHPEQEHFTDKYPHSRDASACISLRDELSDHCIHFRDEYITSFERFPYVPEFCRSHAYKRHRSTDISNALQSIRDRLSSNGEHLIPLKTAAQSSSSSSSSFKYPAIEMVLAVTAIAVVGIDFLYIRHCNKIREENEKLKGKKWWKRIFKLREK